MRWAAMILAGLAIVGGCGTSDAVVAGEPGENTYSGPMRLPVDHADDASVLARSGAAGQALECDGEPYAGGSGDYGDSGLASAQDDAESALADYFSEELFARVPRSGYRVERADESRVLFSYDVDGRTKVALLAADGIRDFDDDEGWGIEAWAQCDPAELPARVTAALGIQVWHDAAGTRIPVTTIESYPGPEHCDWQDITFLALGTGKGQRQYLRDSTGELGDLLTTTFDASATLPRRAIDTGFERDGRRLWLHPDGTAAYLVDKTVAHDIERWPAAKEPIGCA